MRRFIRIATWVAVPLAATLAVLGGCNVGQYEEPAYTVLDASVDGIELRHYAPVIAAEVQVSGERKEAIRSGFRQIADYIFGNNTASQSVAMTAPVVQQPAASETIAMTAPVIQQGSAGKWTVQFIMPSEYTLKTLPTPNNKAVKLKPVAARTVAVIRFSGSKDDHHLAEKTAELKAYLVTQKLKAKSAPIFAFYDPPWTLPFLRRNEILIETVAHTKKH